MKKARPQAEGLKEKGHPPREVQPQVNGMNLNQMFSLRGLLKLAYLAAFN